MITASELAGSLGGKQIGTNKWICRCPAHDDKSPSLSVSEADDCTYKVLFHCFAGCSQIEVISALMSKGLWHHEVVQRPSAKVKFHQTATKDSWVAEYSATQNQFHLQELIRSCEANYHALARGQLLDWVPIFVGSMEHCQKSIEYLKKKLNWKAEKEQAI